MCIHFHNVERGVAVIFPAATKVQYIIDPPDLITTGDAQSQGIILAVAGVGYLDFPQHRRIESPRSTEPVYAKRVVPSVFGSPLPVIDDAGRDRLHVEVGHPVGTHHHGTVLFVESIYNFL